MYFRGPAEAGGWLERASHLLEQMPLGEEHGMLTYLRATSALNGMHNPATARTLAAEGLAIAREIGYVPGEMLFLALDGLALVAAGEVGEGMRRLDEATTAAIAGEVEDARFVELICCHLIDACKGGARRRPAQARGSATAVRRAHPARAGRAPAAGAGTLERRHRGGARAERPHGGVPHRQHLLEGRRLRTDGTGRRDGVRARERPRLKFSTGFREVPYRHGGAASQRGASCRY